MMRLASHNIDGLAVHKRLDGVVLGNGSDALKTSLPLRGKDERFDPYFFSGSYKLSAQSSHVFLISI